MNVLVAVASKHGSTEEIAGVVADELRAAGHLVEVRDVAQRFDVTQYDAAVVGSAIYMGNWMSEAWQFVEGYQEQLQAMPVWLFSSGPLGEEYPEGMGRPETLDELMEMTNARDHTVFVGKLDKDELGFGERMIARVVKAPEGDFRNWPEIRRWAAHIAAELADVAELS
jgi:menaquinone-dependent protoporphyrinogen oxidase